MSLQRVLTTRKQTLERMYPNPCGLASGRRLIRTLCEAQCRTLARLYNHPARGMPHNAGTLHPIGVSRLMTHFPQLLEAKQHLIEENFQSDLFLPASTIDAQTDTRIRRVLQAPGLDLTQSRDDSSPPSDPFS